MGCARPSDGLCTSLRWVVHVPPIRMCLGISDRQRWETPACSLSPFKIGGVARGHQPACSTAPERGAGRPNAPPLLCCCCHCCSRTPPPLQIAWHIHRAFVPMPPRFTYHTPAHTRRSSRSSPCTNNTPAYRGA
eukprot:366083-Chlamydomonas_euryale.AAC.27